MTLRITILVIYFYVFSSFLHAQNIKIQGNIYDSISQVPIEHVELIVNDNSNKAVSDESGFFSLNVNKLPCILLLRHLSYKSKEVIVYSREDKFAFYLLNRSFDLTAVEITANLPVQVMPDLHYHIIDYEFMSDNMVVLAYENQSFFTPVLLLINQDGDTLSKISVSKPKKLCKDYSGKVILYGRTTTYAVNAGSNGLYLSDPMNADDFDAVNHVIISQNDRYYYLRKSSLNDQMLSYYYYDEINDKLHCFRTIVNEDNLKRNNKGCYFDGKEEDIRFQQLIMLKPVYAPLVRINNTLVLFNFIDSRLEKFSQDADLIEENVMGFQPDKSFMKELLIDETDSAVYFLFRRNGLSVLKEFDLKTGELTQTVPIPSFIFVEKIKVHNNVVYFLYKEKYNQEYKKLYKFKI